MAQTRAMTAKNTTIDTKMNADNLEATRPAKAAMAAGTLSQAAGSRFALGDIGNIGAKVSSLTIDPAKKSGAVKKEVLCQQPPITRQKSIRKGLAAAATFSTAKAPAVKNEIYCDVKEPAVIVEPIPSAATLPTPPMDISDDKGALVQVEDIDANDHDNPQLVSEYVSDIYHYMRQLERQLSVRPRYLEGTDITGKMRAILVDWLCQVHNRFHLLQETLFLTVAIIDRYLQEKTVTKSKLQLVGVTSMLLASKYEEMFAPEVADFVYITDNAYSKKEIRDMEREILRTLDFKFGKPLCLHFLRRNSKAGQVDAMKHTLAKYLMELTITEYDMVHLLPSQIAAAALYLSIKVIDNSEWTETLVYYSTYHEDQLVSIAEKMASLVLKAETGKLVAIRSKYSLSKLMKISQIPELKSAFLKDLAAQAS